MKHACSVFLLILLLMIQGCVGFNNHSGKDLIAIRVVPSKLECGTNDVVRLQFVVENRLSCRYPLFIGDLSRRLLRQEAEAPDYPLERWRVVGDQTISPGFCQSLGTTGCRNINAGRIYSEFCSFRITVPGRYRVLLDIDNGTRHLSESSEILIR